MLVGEVRCAMTGFGSSWKLSGGSMLSVGVTNVSKKRQVRRAMRRKSRASGSDTVSLRAAGDDRLLHKASAGAVSHSNAKGRASGQDDGANATAPAVRMRPSDVPPDISRSKH